MPSLDVRDLAREQRDEALEVRRRSFGPLASDALAWWDPLFDKTVAARRAIGVFHEDHLVAWARLHEYRQFWGGRSVPMAGVAGVVVAPEWRGRGVATLLMDAVLRRAVELGDAVSVLFPAAMPPYRKLGYELAGSLWKTTFPATALRALGPSAVPVRRPTAADVDEVVRLLGRAAEVGRVSGPLDLSADDVLQHVDDAEVMAYLAEDGVTFYGWDGPDLVVERLVAESAETTAALWGLVGSGASAVRNVSVYAAPHDPVHWVVVGKAALEVQQERWMLRVLDARGAVERRGFPLGLQVGVPLRLEDSRLSGCDGSFRLEVADGRGRLVADPAPDRTAAVRLGPRGLAALYAGTPLSTLRAAGLVEGGSTRDDQLLDAAFAAHPYLLDRF